ncbi:hypothetical protein L1987_62300 [Smallanthus sonchifolius]|uniref:Uncharacterized protein n=1 Tax=Smallanthus sonchifolius TaxID=185202 RepID=A0ACB9CA03_9ASTR|nr:hypothetical protein L1987_62300 [Smallanthus sonchifolius]
MDKENLFHFPYDFTSTDYETDDRLTRRFSRPASLQHPLFNFKENRVFSGWPESTLSQALSPPPSFVKSDEDAWNLIYAAAKLRMSISNRGVIGVPHAFDHLHRSPWERSDGGELFRQQHFCRNSGASAWPPPQLQNQRLQHCQNQRKPVLHGSGGGCNPAAKRECVGTGVFLPRRYCDNPPESQNRRACNLPAGMIQSSTKSFVPITAPPHLQAHINADFVSHYELLMGRRKAMIPAAQQQQQQRSYIDGGVMESAVNNPAVLLPQEWTY